MNDNLSKQNIKTPEQKFFDLTSDLILRFSGLPGDETDQMILSSLDEVGSYFGVEEVFIVRLDQTTKNWSFLFNSKLQKEGQLLNEYPIGTLPWIEKQIQASKEVIISDVNDMPAEASIDQVLFKKYELQSIIIEPIRGLQESVKGCVGLCSYHGLREWTSGDAERLKMIGSVLVNAFERSILLRDREEKTRFFSLTNHFTQIALESTDFINAINLMLKKLYEISGADFCGIGLWDADSGKVYPAAAFGIEDDEFLTKSFDYSDRIVTAEVLETGKPLVIEDISTTRYLDYKIFRDFPVTSVIVLPLMTKEIKLGSIFIAYSSYHKFNAERLVFYNQISEQITLAMNKIKLWESSQRHYEEMRTLTQISAALRNAQSLSEIPNAVAQTVIDLCRVKNLAILFNGGDQNSRRQFLAGEDWKNLNPDEFETKFAFIDEAVLCGKTAYGRSDFAGRKANNQGEEIYDIAAYPLKAHNQILGVLCVHSPNILNKRNDSILSAVADLIANAAFRQTLMDNLHFQLETLRQTKIQLLQSEKLAAIGELVAGVAHELNNPLTTITLLSELLQRQSDSAQERYDLGKILSESRRAASIIRSLLDFSRQRVSEQQPVNLNLLLQSSIDLIGYELTRNDIDCTLDLDPNLPLTVADPNQIKQVCFNLLTNAIQALKEVAKPRELRVKSEVGFSIFYKQASNPIRYVRLLFEDNGPGISPAILPRIFDPFFTTKKEGEGTGLGLSVCHGIITEHEGHIWAENEPEKGTRIFVEIPVKVPSAEETIKVSTSKYVSDKTAKILIIEDEENVLEVMQRLLMRKGYSCDGVTNGLDGLKCIEKNHYDLIICDLRMPGMSGIEFFQEVERKNPELCQRFVFTTGDNVSEGNQNFLKLTGALVLQKPFEMDTMINVVNKKLSNLANEDTLTL